MVKALFMGILAVIIIVALITLALINSLEKDMEGY